MRRKIIVNADDFGLTTSASTGIIDAHRNGQVNSTTMMVNTPGTEEAVELANANPRLGVGLHFNLTEGRPLTSAQSLVDSDGSFRLREDLIRRVIRKAVNPLDIRQEFEAQLTRFRNLGLEPSHIDSHQHIHMAPGVFRAILPVLNTEARRLRVVRPPRSSPATTNKDLPSKIKGSAMRISGSLMSRRFNGWTNDSFVSMHQLRKGTRWTATCYRQLANSGDRNGWTEFMVHPFAPGPDFEKLYRHDPIRDIRMEFLASCSQEYEILTTQQVFDLDEFEISTWTQVG